MEGIFTISLDFELHWGVFDKRDRQSRESCYRNTLKLVPQMLELFAKYNVHVTWATVGSMFASCQKEWEQMRPSMLPEYAEDKYSAFLWAKENGLSEEFAWAHFAPEEVRSILDYPGQELGTHTFSHYYCLEQLKSKDAFDADLKAVNKAALKFNSKPVSLVFPRNQFNPDHLRICYENGIKVVRSNPSTWFWSPIRDEGSNLIRKVFRTGDAYVPMSLKRTSYPISSININAGEPLQLPASRLLRPWSPKYAIANKLALRRSIVELQTAGERKECYHLWWHPENFGDHPEENMKDLQLLLEQYKKCRNKLGMQSWNMGEYMQLLN
ncbi:MAG: polysaccharide deacetylase family protein [Chitinophagaceae bacterium]|nr:polysaccharide deacetylase family protein [Chitinophagaceae bacterium]